MQYIVLIEISRNHLKEAPYRCNAPPKSLILIPFSCKFITVNFIKMKLLKYPWQFFSKCFLTVISMKWQVSIRNVILGCKFMLPWVVWQALKFLRVRKENIDVLIIHMTENDFLWYCKVHVSKTLQKFI